ncbi:ABC transporter ATP-binding protein [Aggregatilinea lenta]|uniref:ABC transporter ATP-binding protein n=1 Tax=Aggregatilinea lenta TaxID=913108 RepID=UPI000E5B73B9|nr:ABC transporter ATP-binding protein [Aggregatilinea lenta]
MLQVNNIDVAYGDTQVLFDVSLDIQQGELVAVIGANGAGKTTLLRAISGVLKPQSGSIRFGDKVISDQPPNRTVADGVIHVPEGRLLFPDMSVRENLHMGAFLTKDKEVINGRLDSVFSMFPRLKERTSQMAGTLSGGEQQMLAVGRGLMAGPRLLMLDEPSLGLAPKLVQQVFDLAQQINQEMGVTVLLVEQNVRMSCEISSRAFVLENGRVVLKGPGADMLENEHVRRAYLGL